MGEIVYARPVVFEKVFKLRVFFLVNVGLDINLIFQVVPPSGAVYVFKPPFVLPRRVGDSYGAVYKYVFIRSVVVAAVVVDCGYSRVCRVGVGGLYSAEYVFAYVVPAGAVVDVHAAYSAFAVFGEAFGKKVFADYIAFMARVSARVYYPHVAYV